MNQEHRLHKATAAAGRLVWPRSSGFIFLIYVKIALILYLQNNL